MTTPVVIYCSCSHEYQDKKYGKGKRLMNPTQKKPEGEIYRCTVCGSERQRFKH